MLGVWCLVFGHWDDDTYLEPVNGVGANIVVRKRSSSIDHNYARTP